MDWFGVILIVYSIGYFIVLITEIVMDGRLVLQSFGLALLSWLIPITCLGMKIIPWWGKLIKYPE